MVQETVYFHLGKSNSKVLLVCPQKNPEQKGKTSYFFFEIRDNIFVSEKYPLNYKKIIRYLYRTQGLLMMEKQNPIQFNTGKYKKKMNKKKTQLNKNNEIKKEFHL